MKKTVIALTVVTLGLMTAGRTEAFWPFDGAKTSSTSSITTPTFLDRMIEKFNLNKDEVQQVADDFRSERQTSMQKVFEERLTAAVTAGELTEAKKQLILQKHTELKGQREALEQWATDNGIDMSYFGNGRMGKDRGGMMGGRGMGKGMNW